MNEGVSARVVNEPRSVCAPETGADASLPQRRVGGIGRRRAAHAVKVRGSTTKFWELREDVDPNLMTWNTPETTAFPSRHVPPEGHDVILTGTPSGINGDTTGGMAVAIGGIGQWAVRVDQPRPI